VKGKPRSKFALTEKKQLVALKLLAGIPPSELGETIEGAAVLLAMFRKQIENVLEMDPPTDENIKADFRELCDMASSLSKKYGDAADLLKAFPE
jgi:hypothetical protein